MRDVLIVGGGPVGLFLGVLLADAGLDVAVWERRTEPTGSSRAIGVHAPALHALEATGLTTSLLDAAVLVRCGVARSRGQVLGEVSFAGADPRYPFVAAVPQSVTEALLLDRLHQLAPTALVPGVQLGELRALDGTPGTPGALPSALHAVGHASVSTQRTGAVAVPSTQLVEETARFVVGADGARSTVRSLMGITAVPHRYPDTYVMGDFADSTGAGSDAEVYLEPDGVVESFPLPGLRRRFVARTSSRMVDPRPERLAQLVAHRTGLHPDPATCTMISAFTVQRRLAEQMVAGRAVLVGDAAHEISPIGGQGMTLGWLDAAAFAPVLVRAVRNPQPDDALRTALAAVARTRAVSARRAARQAQVNMALGRPRRGVSLAVRDLALRAALATPVRGGLAAAYSMRWS